MCIRDSDRPGCKVEQRSRARQRHSESAFVFDMFTDRVDILDDSEAFVRAFHRRVRWRFARSAVSVGGRSRSRKRGVGSDDFLSEHWPVEASGTAAEKHTSTHVSAHSSSGSSSGSSSSREKESREKKKKKSEEYRNRKMLFSDFSSIR